MIVPIECPTTRAGPASRVSISAARSLAKPSIDSMPATGERPEPSMSGRTTVKRSASAATWGW